jgi:hypothetical protein
MLILALVWAQIVMLGAAVAIWRLLSSQVSQAQTAAQAALESEHKAWSARPKIPEPVVVPAPDLTPYLASLSEMAVGMAKELAAGVSLIVQGPAPVEQLRGEPAEEGRDELAEEPVEVVYPPWETDPSWGITDNQEHDGEWSAHTETVPDGNFDPNYTPTANGGMRRVDGQPMFGAAWVEE